MNPRFFVGIDPGLSGAIACIRETGEICYLLNVPTTKDKKQKAKYDIDKMASWIKHFKDVATNCPVIVFIELVGARPGQGVTSMFRFGYGVGLWEGIVVAHELPLSRVTPQVWKKHFLTGLPKEKESALEFAKLLYPHESKLDEGDKERRIGKADALLIANYARTHTTESGDVRISPPNGRRTRKNAAKGV